MAKWGASMDGQIATFDMDIVEQLHAIVSRGRVGRMLLTILNLENICLSRKNKLLQFLFYLKQKYTNIYNLINKYIFTEYKLRQHIIQEKQKRKAIDKGVLQYYCDRVGIIGDRKTSNTNNAGNKNKSTANTGNLNYNNKRPRQRKTKAARALERDENKRRNRNKRERAAVNKARRGCRKKKQKQKKLKINDLLIKAGIHGIIDKYALFAKNVMMKENMEMTDKDELESDSDKDDDELIAECMDHLSDDESD